MESSSVLRWIHLWAPPRTSATSKTSCSNLILAGPTVSEADDRFTDPEQTLDVLLLIASR